MDRDHSPILAHTATETDKLLIGAAGRGDVEMMELTLDLKPKINAILPDKGTALLAAVDSRITEAVELLLRAGAEPNITNIGCG